MIKKFFCAFAVFVCSAFCFASNLDDEILKAIAFLIPKNNFLIEVGTPCYDETFAASEFSTYLKDSIETIISATGKELFDYDYNNLTESKIAEYSDSGYTLSKTAGVSQRKMPDGTLSSTFSEKNNTVTIFFEYGTFDGKKKKTKISVSTKDLPGLKYEPENLELAKQVYVDVKTAKNIAKTNPEKSITITAVMLDTENNMVNTLSPGDVLNFQINCDKDSFIAIMGIDANGNQYWLPVEDNFMEANVARRFPDGDVNYQVVDGVFGAEVLFIYAATSVDGLPTMVDEKKYQPNLITTTTRGFVATKKKQNMATGVFAIPYTVIAE